MKGIKRGIICFIIWVIIAGCSKSIEQQIAQQLELGQKYLTEMNYEEAVVTFQKVIELDDKIIEAYTGAATAYMRANKENEAEKIIEEGLACFEQEDNQLGEDGWRDFLELAGQYYETQKGLEACVDYWTRIVSITRENEEYKENLERCQGKLAESYLAKSETFLTQENYTDAMDILDKTILIKPTYWDAYEKSITIHLMKKEIEGAMNKYLQIMQEISNPSNENIAEVEKVYDSFIDNMIQYINESQWETICNYLRELQELHHESEEVRQLWNRFFSTRIGEGYVVHPLNEKEAIVIMKKTDSTITTDVFLGDSKEYSVGNEIDVSIVGGFSLRHHSEGTSYLSSINYGVWILAGTTESQPFNGGKADIIDREDNYIKLKVTIEENCSFSFYEMTMSGMMGEESN